MAADELQLRVAVECVAEDEAQQVDARLVVPAPGEHGQACGQFGGKVAVVRGLHGGDGDAGVQVER